MVRAHGGKPILYVTTTMTTTRSPSRSPQSSPRSPRRKNAILPVLGVLVVFSVAADVFMWRGYRRSQARHYGVDGDGMGIVEQMKRDAAWSPVRHEEEMRRAFRLGERKRRRGSYGVDVPRRRGSSPMDVIKETHSGTRQEDSRGQDESGAEMLHGNQRLKKASIALSDKMPIEGHRRREERISNNAVEKIRAGLDKQQPGQHKHDVSMKNKTTSSARVLPDDPKTRTKVTSNGATGTKRRKDKRKHGQRKHNVTSKQDDIPRKKVNKNQRPRIRSFRQHPFRKTRRFPPMNLSLPAQTEFIKSGQLVILDGNHAIVSNKHNNTKLKDWLAKREDESDNASEDEELARRSQTVVWENDQDCVPMAKWQTTVHPTCNSVHEMDISQSLSDDAFSLVSSKGHWRNAWKVDSAAWVNNWNNSSRTEQPKGHDDKASVPRHAVLKSLKYIHDPNKEVFELSRVDAISLDVLTSSRYTINIYGFCGSSSIQEFAGGDLKGLLPSLDPIERLRMATYVAGGVADIHAVSSSDGPVRGGNKTDSPVSLIHNDINMDNVLLGYRNGASMPILNDMNIAVFRKKDRRTGEPCRFHGRFANPQWMSPEQQERPEDELSTGYLNEKIDIYALGNILYKIAVGNSPWKYEYLRSGVKKITPEIKAKIARAKLRGAKPKVPPEVRNSTSPGIRAVLTAMDRCYRNDAELRPSAREIAGYLREELDAAELPNKVMDRFDFD